MALDSRIVRRPNGTYSFRGSVPADLRGVIPGGASGQKWIALGTSDPAEAKRRARLKSVEFDRQLLDARRFLRGEEDSIPDAEIARLGALWLSQRLTEDEGYRRYGRDTQAHEESNIELEGDDYYLRQALALNSAEGPFGDFGFKVRLEEQGIKLKVGSEAWRKLFFEYLKSQKRATEVMMARNAGDVVETPPPPSAVSAVRSYTVEELIADYLADPTRKRTPGTLKTYQTVFRAMRELLGADTAVDTIPRTDCERIRSVIMRLPKNASQRFRGLSLEEAAKIADAEKLERLALLWQIGFRVAG